MQLVHRNTLPFTSTYLTADLSQRHISCSNVIKRMRINPKSKIGDTKQFEKLLGLGLLIGQLHKSVVHTITFNMNYKFMIVYDYRLSFYCNVKYKKNMFMHLILALKSVSYIYAFTLRKLKVVIEIGQWSKCNKIQLVS